MSAPAGSPLNTLRITDCTLHAVPCEGGVEFHVITRDGVQAVIVPASLKEAAIFTQETQNVLTGEPAHVYSAGARRMQREMTRQPHTVQTSPPGPAKEKD